MKAINGNNDIYIEYNSWGKKDSPIFIVSDKLKVFRIYKYCYQKLCPSFDRYCNKVKKKTVRIHVQFSIPIR